MTTPVRIRYFAKLVASMASMAIGLVTQAIIPRALGVRGFGDYQFLSAFFAEVCAFFDMGSSIGFIAKLSQRPQEQRLVLFYGYFMSGVSLFLVGGIALCYLLGVESMLWPGQTIGNVLLGGVLGLVMWFSQILGRMVDALALTVTGEIVRVVHKAFVAMVLAGLFLLGILDLRVFLLWNIGVFLTLTLLLSALIVLRGECAPREWCLPWEAISKYCREFWEYCHPLIVYAGIGLVVGVFDRWILQISCGSKEQGMFGLANQLSILCFMFTGAMTPIISREFAVAFERRDFEHMSQCFRRYIPPLFAVAAFFGCFTAVNATAIIRLFGGKEYASAWYTVVIMSLYPIHQAYGQLSGSVFYATGQTKLYRNIGVTFMLLGLPISYCLIASEGFWGFQGGALGLAVKMVFIQILSVNVQLYFNAHLLNLPLRRYLAHQIVCLVALAGIAGLALAGTRAILSPGIPPFMEFGVSGFLYIGGVVIGVWVEPRIFGLNRATIRSIIGSLR